MCKNAQWQPFSPLTCPQWWSSIDHLSGDGTVRFYTGSQFLLQKHITVLYHTRWRVTLKQAQQFDRQPWRSNKVVCIVLQVDGCGRHNLDKQEQDSKLTDVEVRFYLWPQWDEDIMWSQWKTPTLLSLATASEMEVLKSLGLFWARVVIRLVAAVTTPW